MSRANSVERERKPLPPVPPATNNTYSLADSTQTSTTERIAQTLKKMSEDIPTTEYRSPLNIVGRIKNELADIAREIPVGAGARSITHDHHAQDKSRQAPPATSEVPADHHQTPGEVESITSAEQIRRNWEESQKSPSRHTPQRHKSKPSKDASRHKGTAVLPTAYRSGDGFPWVSQSQSRDHSRSRHPDDTHSHRRERPEEDPARDVEIYGNSDESEPHTPVLEIHNATPINEEEAMKSRNRPGLTSRFRSSLQRIGVGSTRPVKQRADISRSPSPDRGSRSPSPNTWRKPSPHSSIRANDQYSTPHATRFPDTLPRIESQKMDLDWGPSLDHPQTPPPRPDETLPIIPDLHTPGIRFETGPRSVQIIDGDRLRSTEAREQAPAHQVEKSDATTVTAVSAPSQREYFRDGDYVLHNVRGPHDVYEGRDVVPGRLKRLLSLNGGRNVPIDGPDSVPAGSPPPPHRAKAHPTPAGIIRSASLIRTRSRRKESSKPQEHRVEPEVVHVDYESDGWGESPPVVRDAQGRIIPTVTPKRRGSLKNKTTGPTKIALPMGQVEEFHSVHSNSPTEAAPKDLVSSVPMLRSEHKRTTSTTTFHTAQSEATRPNTPARRPSTGSARQVKTSGASESRHEGWRRSRAGAPRRPSQTLLTTTTGATENQYADEEVLAHDPQIVVPAHELDYRGHHQETSDSYFPAHPVPVIVHRSRSPAPQEQTAHILPAQGPLFVPAHNPAPPARSLPPAPPPPTHSPPPAPAPSPPPSPPPHSPPQEIRPISPPHLNPRARSPPPLLEPGRSYTPPLRHSYVSPEQSPPTRAPRAQTPPLEDREVHILPADSLPGERYPHDLPRYQTLIDPQVEPAVHSPALDTPYALPQMPTPAPTSPGVLLDRPSPTASPVIDRSAPLGPRTPPRSVHIEYADEVRDAQPSERPLPRPMTELSGTEQQRRSQNRKTGSEMSFIAVEPLTKREKLAASMLSISSMPWLRGRLSSSRSQPYTESSYHSTHEEDDPHYHDRHDQHERYRQRPSYLASPTVPQLPPMSHSPPPRPEVGKLPSWYPREQAARAAASSPLARDSRGPRIGQEAWGWRSSPDPHRFGIPEEPEEDPSQPTTMPPWPYAGGVVTPGPDMQNDMIRGESMMTPPILPPRPAAPSSESTPRASGEKKRMPKYRIEQDDRGYPVLVPEPGFDDSRWTVFEIGGVQFKRAPVAGEGGGGHGAQWVPNRLSGRRPESHVSPLAHHYSDSPAPIHTVLEGRHYGA